MYGASTSGSQGQCIVCRPSSSHYAMKNRGFNMASDCLAAVLSANHMSGLEIFVNYHGFWYENFLTNLTPVQYTDRRFAENIPRIMYTVRVVGWVTTSWIHIRLVFLNGTMVVLIIISFRVLGIQVEAPIWVESRKFFPDIFGYRLPKKGIT